MTGKKAFVGPLGDDFPSIFPIVAGVLLFLGTVAYAAGVVDQKNAYFEIRQASLGLGYTLTQRGSLTQMEFDALCGEQATEFARSKAVKFKATLVSRCDGYVYSDDAEFGEWGDEGYASCDSHGDEEEDYVLSEVAGKNPVVLDYPMAVPCPEAGSNQYGLGSVVVMVWR
ncbi:MAG: hypothetical protein WC607_03580 [Candidatus Micrarchaeia archaeon]